MFAQPGSKIWFLGQNRLLGPPLRAESRPNGSPCANICIITGVAKRQGALAPPLQVPAGPPTPHTHVPQDPALRGQGCCRLQPNPWSHSLFVTRVTGPGTRKVPAGGCDPLCASSPPHHCLVWGHLGAMPPLPAAVRPAGRERMAFPAVVNSARTPRGRDGETPCGHFSATSCVPLFQRERRWAQGRWAAGLAAPSRSTPSGGDHSGPNTIAVGQAEIEVSLVLDCASTSHAAGTLQTG